MGIHTENGALFRPAVVPSESHTMGPIHLHLKQQSFDNNWKQNLFLGANNGFLKEFQNRPCRWLQSIVDQLTLLYPFKDEFASETLMG